MNPIYLMQRIARWFARREARSMRSLGIRWLFFWCLFGIEQTQQPRRSVPSQTLEAA